MATAVTTTGEDTRTIEPFTEQEPFLWDEHRFYNFAAGVGSGKTAIGVIRNTLNAEVWNPGYMGAIIAPTTQMIKNAIVPKMQEFGIYDRWEYYGPSAELPGFHTPQESRVVVLSADNERHVERAAGLDLAWWHMDEARDVPKRMFEILQQRLRVGNYMNGYTTSTPRKNHYEAWCFTNTPTEPESYGEADIYDGTDRLTITGVTPDCNPFVPDDYESRLLRDLPEEIAAQEVKGQFIELGGGIYTREMFNFTPADELDTDWQLQYVVGVDPATEPDKQSAEAKDTDYWAATLAAVHHRRNTIYPIQSVRARGLTLRQGVNWVSQITADINCRVFVESNQSQIFLQQELQNQGVNAIPIHATQNKEDRIFDLSIPIENGTIEFVNQETDANLGYDPRWQNLMQELLAFPDGTHDDLADSLWLVVDNAEINVGLGGLSAEMYDTE